MRTIIAAIVALAIAVLVGVVALVVQDDGARRAGALTTGSVSSTGWALFEGSTRLGDVKNLGCGAFGADVIADPVGAEKVEGKTIGPVKYAPCQLEVGLRLPQAFYAWLIDPAANKGPKTLELVGFGSDGKPKESIRLLNALPTHVEFGEFDASDGTRPVAVEVTLAAAPQIRSAESAQTAATSPTTQKVALSANFKVSMNGVEVLASRVGGLSFDYDAGKTKLGNLKLTVPESAAATVANLDQWAQKFLVDGVSGAASERSLQVKLMTADLKNELAVIDFQGVGIFNVDRGTAEPGADAIRKFGYSLYVEGLKLNLLQ